MTRRAWVLSLTAAVLLGATGCGREAKSTPPANLDYPIPKEASSGKGKGAVPPTTGKID